MLPQLLLCGRSSSSWRGSGAACPARDLLPAPPHQLCLQMRSFTSAWKCKLSSRRGVCVVFPSRLYQVTKPPATTDKRKRRAEVLCGTSLLGNMTGACRPVWPPTGANQRGLVWPICSTGAPGRRQQNPTVVLSYFRASRWLMNLTSVRSL